MMNYKFDWGFSKRDFEKYKENFSNDYIGNIRVGALCFDMFQIEEDGTIWFDCYAGGVDTGYGCNAEGYPYDHVDPNIGASIKWKWYNDRSYNQFVVEVEREITHYINDTIKYVDSNGNIVNLIELASQPVVKW